MGGTAVTGCLRGCLYLIGWALALIGLLWLLVLVLTLGWRP